MKKHFFKINELNSMSEHFSVQMGWYKGKKDIQ